MRKLLLLLFVWPLLAEAQVTVTNSSYGNGSGTGSDGTITVISSLGASGSINIPGNDVAARPTRNPDSIRVSNLFSTVADVSFRPGNGMRRIAVLKAGTPPSFVPQDDHIYSGDLSDGQTLVYDGSGNSFSLSGLQPDTPYYLTLFEVNVNGGSASYLTVGAPLSSFRTLPRPNVFVTSPANGTIDRPIALSVTARALTGATTYTIELNDSSNFNGNAYVMSGARTQNFSGLSYAKVYYTRVRTNLSPDYGTSTTFQTLMPNIYVSSPADNSTDRPTTLSITSVALTGATSYTIEINESPDFSGVGFVQTGTRTQTFTGLKYTQQYYARVKTDIYPVYGKVTTFTTGIPQVYVTTPADGAVNQNSTLNISARALTGANTYTIELNELPTFTGPGIIQTGARTQTFSGLKYNQLYYARVRTDVSPVYGKTTSFTTADASTFAYVTSPANGAVDRNANLTISSNLVFGATQYTIQLSERPDFASIAFSVTGATRSLIVNGLKYSTTYYSRVLTDMSTQYGQVRSFTTRSAEGLAYVTSPADGAIDRNTVLTITSNTVPNATLYTIQLSETNQFDQVAFQQTGSSRSLAFSGLKYNTTYYNRVITNAEVTFDYGPVRSFTTRTAESISYVTSPANGAIGVNNSSVNISANSVPGASSYTIQLSESVDFSTIAVQQTGTTRTLNFTGLKYNTTYYNRVITDLTNNFGEVRSFATRTAESLAYVTSPADGATNISVSPNITSNTVPGATTYKIQLSKTPDFAVIATERAGSVRTMSFTGLDPGTLYYNRVGTNLTSAYGAVRSFTTAGTPPATSSTTARIAGTGTVAKDVDLEVPVEKEMQGDSVTLSIAAFPNPFHDKLSLYIASDIYSTVALTIFDLQGKSIHQSEEKTNQRFEVEKDLNAGVYLLKVQSGEAIRTLKVIKER